MQPDDAFGLLILLGLIPATIKFHKGYSFWLNWLAGALFFPIALPVAIVSKPNGDALVARAERDAAARGETRCPACREFIRAEATICPHCRTLATARDVEEPSRPPVAAARPASAAFAPAGAAHDERAAGAKPWLATP
jgi:hypothetical protein